jgi:hypothetical protein
MQGHQAPAAGTTGPSGVAAGHQAVAVTGMAEAGIDTAAIGACGAYARLWLVFVWTCVLFAASLCRRVYTFELISCLYVDVREYYRPH